MERDRNASSDLDRAYVQCQVIEASLQHLSVTLARRRPGAAPRPVVVRGALRRLRAAAARAA